MEQYFNLHLPKWPGMKLTGNSVSIEQAKDIISRTDKFIIDMSKDAGGNNREWNKWANETLHFTKLIELQKFDTWYQSEINLNQSLMNFLRKINHALRNYCYSRIDFT